MSIGRVLGFSLDMFGPLSPEMEKAVAKVGDFIPGIVKGVGKNGTTAAAAASKQKFVDGTRDDQARKLVDVGIRKMPGNSRDYAKKIKQGASSSLPPGAVGKVAASILEGARAGGKALELAAYFYQSICLGTCEGVSQSPRGDFQQDDSRLNKGVA